MKLHKNQHLAGMSLLVAWQLPTKTNYQLNACFCRHRGASLFNSIGIRWWEHCQAAVDGHVLSGNYFLIHYRFALQYSRKLILLRNITPTSKNIHHIDATKAAAQFEVSRS